MTKFSKNHPLEEQTEQKKMKTKQKLGSKNKNELVFFLLLVGCESIFYDAHKTTNAWKLFTRVKDK